MGGVGPLSFRAWKDGGPPRGGKGRPRVAETVTGERDREAATRRRRQRQKQETDGGASQQGGDNGGPVADGERGKE